MLGEGDRAGGSRGEAWAQWPAEVIEDALDREVAALLPAGLRTRRIAARLPRYQADMLEYLALERQTTIGHLLSQQLDDLASEHLDELSAAIPGFAEAFAWPHGEEAPEARVQAGGGRMRLRC